MTKSIAVHGLAIRTDVDVRIAHVPIETMRGSTRGKSTDGRYVQNDSYKKHVALLSTSVKRVESFGEEGLGIYRDRDGGVVMADRCLRCGGSGLEPDDKKTGLEMRQRRLNVSLSQRQLAARVGISPVYLSDLERGRRRWAPIQSRVIEAIREASQ